jgi:TolA-binding protein
MTKTILKSLAVATLLSTSALAAFAATKPAPAYATQASMLQTADEPLTAVTRAHAARLALFENDIEAAKGRLAEARAEFLDAEKKFNDLTIGDTEEPESAERFLPFDMSMALTETFQATPENTQALEKAYGMMQTGSQDEAIEVLRMASIDVNVSAAMLPIAEVTTQLQNAQNFIDEGKYYDANLALKAVEDSVVVRSFSIDAIPQQGDIE